jgi:outer membrane protein assembly factor BamE (lipoprotein component of BamABCDE complex)
VKLFILPRIEMTIQRLLSVGGFCAIALILNSCASLTKARLANISQIHPGQSTEEVKSILGSPKQRIANGKLEIWYYEVYSDDSSRVYSYSAKFENEVLKKFEADDSRMAEDRKLREQRANSNQAIIPLVGPNGSPPLLGTDSK